MEENPFRRSHSVNSSDLTTKLGWLLKQTSGLVRQYKRKYLVLEHKNFYIYTDENREDLRYCINFDQVTASIQRDPKDQFRLIMAFKGHEKKLYFKGLSVEEISEWEKEISVHIKNSKGNQSVLQNFGATEEFWKFNYLNEKDFSRNAETGDLIFFRGKTTLCGALRSILKCDFDHIALVYILNDNIYLFESARSTGVSLLSWDEFISRKWYRLYQRIAYRKLELQRNEQFLEKSDQFVTENEGKPYKLVKFKKNDNQGYFCSELIAEFYKFTGVFYQNTPGNRFMPRDFVFGKNLKIVQGELGHLQDIKFNIN